jgi:outer membrane protein OmpA-like peptidoglycan-associated protein
MQTPRLWLAVMAGAAALASSAIASAGTLGTAPNPRDFGSVLVLQTDADTVVITNTGSNTTITGFTEQGGGNCNQFTETASGLPATLGNGGTLTVDLTFTPTTRGAKTCTVTINDDNGTADTFVLNGAGVGPVLLTSTTGLTFAAQPVTGGSATQNFTITNNGENNLTISVAEMGTATADYSYTTNVPETDPIPPAGTITFTVTFDATAEGTRDAQLVITSNDPLNASDTVDLTGSGQVRRITTSPDPLTFASVVSGTSSSQNIVVGNSGQIALSLQSASMTGSSWITFTGTPQADCLGDQTCDYSPDLSVNASATRNIGIQCAPPLGSTGTQNATVSFTSNSDGTGADNSVTVNCTAQKPDITVSTTAFDFGDVPVATLASTTVTVMNTGTATLTYDITFTGTNPGDFSYAGTQCTAGTPCTLTAGNSRAFTVRFQPPVDGARSATMNINSNDQEPADQVKTVDLDGNGTGAEITRTTASPMPFGQVVVGSSSTLPLTVRNDGNVDLSITAISVPTGYTFSPTVPPTSTLTPGQTRTFNITCTPTARQNFNGNVVFTNSSYNTPTLTTAVTCQGVSADLRVNNVDIHTHDFGGLPEGSTPVTQNFTLRNAGERDANNIAAALDITTSGYTFTGIPTTLAAGAQTTFMVTFTPTAAQQGGPAQLSINADPQAALNPSLEDARLDLDGDSQSNGIDTSTANVTFPDTRWDQTSTQTFTVSNTGQSTFQVTQFLNSNATDFAVTNIAVDTAGNGTVVNQGTFAPFTLCGTNDTSGACPGTNGGVATVTVQFQPNDTMLGAFAGTLTIICNLPSSNMRMVALAGNSVSPMLTVDPTVVSFVDVDVDAGGAVQTLRLRNTSTSGNMNVTSHSAFTGSFDDTGFVAGVVTPGNSNDTTITYTPAMAGTETIMVTYNVTGLYPMVGPTMVQVMVTGNAIDREIATTTDSIVFQPTYPYPSTPTRETVTVNNLGAAPLMLSAVMLTSEPPFVLVEGEAQTVPGNGSASFTIEFAPTMVGQFDGQLLITHNDNGNPMAEIDLSGMAIDREMVYSPTVEFGTAIVGDTLRNDEVLELVNMSNTTTHPTTFAVHELRVADTTGVIAFDAPGDRPVAAGETAHFGGTFTPTQAGPFTTTVQLFLDGAPDPHGEITVTGHAVEVEVEGGGCATSGGGGAGTIILVLGVALALGARRRRRALAGFPVAGVVLVALAPGARADVTVQSFHPLPSIEDDLFEVESATVGQANAWAAGLAFTYARDPLVSTVVACGSECPPPDPVTGEQVSVGDRASLVKQQSVITIGGAYAIANRFEVGVAVPIMNQTGDPSMLGASADGSTLGDIALHGKVQLLEIGRLALGASAVVTAPTAKDGQYAGYSGPSGAVDLLVSRRARRVLLSLNAGFLGRKTEEFASVAQGSALTFGAGGGFRVISSVWLAAEVFGEYGMVSDAQTTLQALGGLRVRLGSISIGIGGGAGLNKGVGVPKARGFLLLSYSPRMRPEEAIRPPPPPPDTRDTDADGIRNVDDKCPNEAEDVDLFEDADGCPDFDNDNDQVADTTDSCDDAAEDLDGYQDADGCPDEDNDGDGIADKTDVCPNDVEDKDGHADLDGCPDDDNDHDGVADLTDKCPAQAETINGNNDDDGCPDRGDSLILLAADRIELMDTIKFSGATAKLGKGSANLLGQVGATLRANPEIVRISVRAHVHPRASREKDQELSDQRAKAVRDWLVNWGVAADRIDVRGFGSDKPLVKASAKGAEQINDRIEFIIMERNE